MKLNSREYIALTVTIARIAEVVAELPLEDVLADLTSTGVVDPNWSALVERMIAVKAARRNIRKGQPREVTTSNVIAARKILELLLRS